MQQDPPYCEAETDAPAMAEQGANFLCQTLCAVGCAVRIRGGPRWKQLQEIRGARDASEPPHHQEPLGQSRGGVRFCEPRSVGYPM